MLSIGLSLISVGVNAFGGGSSAVDFGSVENLCPAFVVLVAILTVKHSTTGFLSASSILVGIIVSYILAAIMGMVLPATAICSDGVECTKAWVLSWDKVVAASWFAVPDLMPVAPEMVSLIFGGSGIVATAAVSVNVSITLGWSALVFCGVAHADGLVRWRCRSAVPGSKPKSRASPAPYSP